MKVLRAFLVSSALFLSTQLYAQPDVREEHMQDLIGWQHHYKMELHEDARSPVHGTDTSLLRFYPINLKWRCTAKVRFTPESKPFDMATHSGKTKQFRTYAVISFKAPGKGNREYTLHAYERVNPPAGDTLSPVLLFIPFQDLSSGKESYGGGRYIDIPKSSFDEGLVWLDFNKAYNPYCAFGGNYSCPIPPVENRLTLKVEAGERMPAPPLGAED